MIEISDSDIEKLLNVGFDVKDKERIGSFFLLNNTIVEAKLHDKGIELMPLSMAVDKYDWIKDYLWKAVNKDKDAFTKIVYKKDLQGYFIRTLPGAKTYFPIQACFYMKESGMTQVVHNLIIAEEGSELHLINGCAVATYGNKGSHIAVTEFFIKKDAKVTYTMIHDWAKDVVVRPRSTAVVGENGVFISNYASLKPVRSTQSAPNVYLMGANSIAKLYSILYAERGTNLDIGGTIYLKGERSSGEIVSRIISNGGNIRSVGNLYVEAKDIKAHMECNGILINDSGTIDTIPQLIAKNKEVEMSHEAVVGKIAKDEIEYLMARGISERDSISLILRGFLDIKIEGLPPVLQRSINNAVELSMKGL